MMKVDPKAMMLKKGGKAKKKKDMKIGGKMAAKRLDKPKRASGGRMTPGSPYSGAGNVTAWAGAGDDKLDSSND